MNAKNEISPLFVGALYFQIYNSYYFTSAFWVAGNTELPSNSYPEYVRREMNDRYVDIFSTTNHFWRLEEDIRKMQTNLESLWTQDMTAGLMEELDGSNLDFCWIRLVMLTWPKP